MEPAPSRRLKQYVHFHVFVRTYRLSNRTQCSFSNFANGERIAFARESAKRVGPMLEQHHLPRREKRQMPSCRWRRSKYFVFRYSTLYTVRKPHQRHVLIAHCTSREHTTWHSLPSERSTNDAQEERFRDFLRHFACTSHDGKRAHF